ncbi:uncharacterized protein LOC123511684 [Portunus trituberculatus]|uniref:uncharacterized protein LOC123511684 n=1 Tax=Portunus trituberculatus TaxID=210409 RepID=UPI001E1CBC16|nr:uncharacterized protein LOC123511684 [Portunus trituberculatus]
MCEGDVVGIEGIIIHALRYSHPANPPPPPSAAVHARAVYEYGGVPPREAAALRTLTPTASPSLMCLWEGVGRKTSNTTLVRASEGDAWRGTGRNEVRNKAASCRRVIRKTEQTQQKSYRNSLKDDLGASSLLAETRLHRGQVIDSEALPPSWQRSPMSLTVLPRPQPPALPGGLGHAPPSPHNATFSSDSRSVFLLCNLPRLTPRGLPGWGRGGKGDTLVASSSQQTRWEAPCSAFWPFLYLPFSS